MNDGFPIPPWVANDANSRWIGPATDNDANGAGGTYTYQTTFTLPAAVDLTSVAITGLWAADDANPADLIRLNGVVVEAGNNGFGSYTSFTISAAGGDVFQPGVNTLQFDVINGGGPTGLRIDDMTGTFVPEPASAAVLALGGFGLLLRRRR